MLTSNYLLDTNHCFHIINGNFNLLGKLNNKLDSSFYISTTIAGELYYMVYKSQHKEKNLENINSFINDISVISIDNDIARIYGELKAKLVLHFGPKDKNKQRGITTSSIGFKENDLWISATAIQKSFILLTADSDFIRIKDVMELQTESWI